MRPLGREGDMAMEIRFQKTTWDRDDPRGPQPALYGFGFHQVKLDKNGCLRGVADAIPYKANEGRWHIHLLASPEEFKILLREYVEKFSEESLPLLAELLQLAVKKEGY